tara:strand:- start:1310 stop:1456 length:147 start_codon:yes stop_codon:yes gene_type:complete
MDTIQIQQLYQQNIMSAFSEAMKLKTDDMSTEHFKNLVLFFLQMKSGL